MIESLEELKDCGHARLSTPAVGIHSSAKACGMILDEGWYGGGGTQVNAFVGRLRCLLEC